MDYFGRVAEILVTVILLFFVPLSYMAAKSDFLCQTYVTTETTYFVDAVRNIGFVDKQMYEEFVKKLAVTQIPYEISMSHYKDTIKEQEIKIAIEEEQEEVSYIQYYEGIYHKDILQSLLETEQYLFQQGDFFSVLVKKKGLTWSDRLENFLTGRNQQKEEIQVIYGGAVRDEIR